MMTRTLPPDAVLRLLRELSAISKLGLPIPQALESLSRDSRRDPLTSVVAGLIHDLQSGMSLSRALEKCHPKAPPEVIALLRCGEVAGTISPLADATSNSVSRTLKTRQHLEMLAAYPTLLLGCCVAFYALIVGHVLPTVMGAIAPEDLEAVLNSTPALILFQPALSGAGQEAALLSLGFALLLFAIALFRPFRPIIHWIGSSIGPIQRLSALGDMANLLRFLSAMTHRGVPLPECLRAVSGAMVLPSTRKAALRMADAAEKSQPIHPHLPAGLPQTLTVLLAQGEAGGRLPEAIDSLAQWCEETYEHREMRIMAVLEPVLILLVGGTVTGMLGIVYVLLTRLPGLVKDTGF